MNRDALEWFAICLFAGLVGIFGLACWLVTRVWFWLGALVITLILQGGIAA
jgi:hypothetical protein